MQRRGRAVIQRGDGVDLSPGEHSQTAGKVRGSTQVQRKEAGGQSVIPVGRWSGFESAECSPHPPERKTPTNSWQSKGGQLFNPAGNGLYVTVTKVRVSAKSAPPARTGHTIVRYEKGRFSGAMEEGLRRFDSFPLLTYPCQTRQVPIRFQTWLLHWGDGLLRNSQRFECRPRAHPLPEQDTHQSATRKSNSAGRWTVT